MYFCFYDPMKILCSFTITNTVHINRFSHLEAIEHTEVFHEVVAMVVAIRRHVIFAAYFAQVLAF